MSSDNILAPFDAKVAGLLTRLTPAQRKLLARGLARRLRASQSARIAAQENPDGDAYVPRKPQPRLRQRRGGLRRKMFTKLRTNKWLRASASENAAVITFAGAAQRIARVHQYGLRDRVNKTSGLTVSYPQRQLLGLTDAELSAIEDAVLDHLAGGLL